jgi:hypothetical protein
VAEVVGEVAARRLAREKKGGERRRKEKKGEMLTSHDFVGSWFAELGVFDFVAVAHGA